MQPLGTGATSWGTNRLDMFVAGPDSALWTKSWTGNFLVPPFDKLWIGWNQLLPNPIASTPVAASRGPNSIDVLVRGTDDVPYHTQWDGTKWLNWEPLGPEKILFSPAVVARGLNRLDVFVHGTDHALYTKSWDGQSWSGYTQLAPNAIASSPAAASWGPDRMDVFVQGTDNALYTKSWNGTAWSGYTQLGSNQIASSPAVVAWGANRLDVFVRGTDNALYTKSWNGSAWSGYSQLSPSPIADDPAAASSGPNLIDVFVRGTDNNLYTKSWNGILWSDYQSMGQPSFPALPAIPSCINFGLQWYGFDLTLDEPCTASLKSLTDQLLQLQGGGGSLGAVIAGVLRNNLSNAIKGGGIISGLAKSLSSAILTAIILAETTLLDKALAAADKGSGVTLHFSFLPIGISLLTGFGAILLAFEEFATNAALAGNLINVGLANPVTTVFWITSN